MVDIELSSFTKTEEEPFKESELTSYVTLVTFAISEEVKNLWFSVYS